MIRTAAERPYKLASCCAADIYVSVGTRLQKPKQALSTQVSAVPIIDLGKCDTPEGRLATAYEIRDACMRVGFFYIRNHDIPQIYLDSVFSAMERFFSLPMAMKMKLHSKAATDYKGYNAPLDKNIDSAHNHQGDFNEGFDIGREEIEARGNDEGRASNGATAGGNVWPLDDCPGFREACLEYYHAAMEVGKLLYTLFALALELPETYFDDKTRNSAARMKVIHYPSRDEHPEIYNDTPGVGAHTDFKCFTILWQQSDVEGLQLKDSKEQWIDAPAIRDTLIVNIGDQLALWTNDIFKSTVHRVVNKTGKERYSIPLFFGTDYDVNIEPIPSCVSADRPAKFTSINSGEYFKRRLAEAFRAA
ncbi:2OG-Fe(II) oxygenase [Chiua virens]|nr:2OG-Fe(II) oxygenase [Chiua virens]